MKKIKIFIDTNFFLDFYRSNTDKLKILKDLKKHSSYLVFPEQVYSEFLRNRDNILSFLLENFVRSCKINIHDSSLIQNLNDFKKLKKIKKDFQNTFKKIKKYLEDIKNNIDKDPVYKAFYTLYNSEKSKRYSIDENLIKKAHERYLLGNPPGDNKKTIGDQLIWEILISNLEENLIVVARDKTYKNNSLFLKTEFKKKTGKELIDITDKIYDALQEIGVKTPDEIKELEEKQEIELRPEFTNFAFFNPHTYTPGSAVAYVQCDLPNQLDGSGWQIVNDSINPIISPPEYGTCKSCGKYGQLFESNCYECYLNYLSNR